MRRKPLALGDRHRAADDGLACRVARRDDNDGNIVQRRVLAFRLEELKSIHVGHGQIEQDHVRPELANNAQSLSPISGQQDTIPALCRS